MTGAMTAAMTGATAARTAGTGADGVPGSRGAWVNPLRRVLRCTLRGAARPEHPTGKRSAPKRSLGLVLRWLAPYCVNLNGIGV